MGNDGTNVLLIYGSPAVLKKIEQSKACVSRMMGEPVYYETLRNDYFATATYSYVAPNCLKIVYDFRNQVCEDYLTDLAKMYPSVWMKNEYKSEEGFAGVFIVCMTNGEVDTQRHEWSELCLEEKIFYGMNQ